MQRYKTVLQNVADVAQINYVIPISTLVNCILFYSLNHIINKLFLL